MKTGPYLKAIVIAAVLALPPFTPAKVTSLTPSTTLQEPTASADTEQATFTKGQRLYLQGNYTQAAEVLELFLKTYPNSIITDLTLLWLGRSYYQLGKFSKAEQVGKVLRAIKDTPFAEIYDTELRTAQREVAAKQKSASAVENVASRPPSRSSPVPPSPAARNRYAKAAASNPPPNTEVRSKVTSPAPRPATTATGRSNTATPSNNKVTRQPVKAGSTKTKQPPSTNNRTVRPNKASSSPRDLSASNDLRRSNKASQPSRKPASTAPQRSAQSNQRIAAKPKPSSGSRERTLPVGKQAPRQVASNVNQPAARNKSQQRDAGPSSRRKTVAGRASLTRDARGSADFPTDGSAPASQSGHAVTGGLYSMVDAAELSAPTDTDTEVQMRVEVLSKRLTAKPGEVIFLSFVVRHSGSTRQTYELRITAPGAPQARMYVDSNRDGVHQSDELLVTGSPVVELKNSEVPLLLEVAVPRDAFEGQQYSYTLVVLTFGKSEVVTTATSTLTVSSIRARLLPANAPDSAVLSR